MTHYEEIPNPTPGQLAAELNRVIQYSGTVEGRTAALKDWAYYRAMPTIEALKSYQTVIDSADEAIARLDEKLEESWKTGEKLIGEGG